MVGSIYLALDIYISSPSTKRCALRNSIYFPKVHAFPRMQGICTDEFIHHNAKVLNPHSQCHVKLQFYV